MTAAAMLALTGMLVMHGLPLPGVAAFHLGMVMDRPTEHAGGWPMPEHTSISTAGVMAGPHNCVPDGPRTLRLVPPPAPSGPSLDVAALGGVTLAAPPASGALARASPSLDRLCVSRR